jgi:hypothetical protein
LGEFTPLGSLLKTTEAAYFWGPWKNLSITFAKKWYGIHFGLVFYKLIWSPWSWAWFIDAGCESLLAFVKCSNEVKDEREKKTVLLLAGYYSHCG